MSAKRVEMEALRSRAARRASSWITLEKRGPIVLKGTPKSVVSQLHKQKRVL